MRRWSGRKTKWPYFQTYSRARARDVQVLSGADWRQSASGVDFGVDLWAGRTKRYWRPSWEALSLDDEQTLREFYEQNANNTFYLFDFDSRRKYSGVEADEEGTGSLDTFTLPGHTLSTTGLTVYVGSTAVSAASWSFSAGNGVNGEDQIVFSAATPANGATVSADFTGRRRYLTRFDGGPSGQMRYYPTLKFAFIEVFE